VRFEITRVEPVVEVPSMLLRQRARLGPVGGQSGLDRADEALDVLVRLGLDPNPVVLRVGGRAPGGLPPRVLVPPLLLRLRRVLLQAVGAEDLKLLLGVSAMPISCASISCSIARSSPSIRDRRSRSRRCCRRR
jgi:hypothetical protein